MAEMMGDDGWKGVDAASPRRQESVSTAAPAQVSSDISRMRQEGPGMAYDKATTLQAIADIPSAVTRRVDQLHSWPMKRWCNMEKRENKL